MQFGVTANKEKWKMNLPFMCIHNQIHGQLPVENEWKGTVMPASNTNTLGLWKRLTASNLVGGIATNI